MEKIMVEPLLEMSYMKLLYNTRTGFDSKRKQKSTEVKLTNTIFIPYIEDNMLEAQSESRTVNDTYTSKIIFQNVIFKTEVTSQTASVVGTDGTEYNFMKIHKNRTDVKVSCTCLDFHYRFAAYNQRDNALAGDSPETYVKKTDRKPANPSKVSGLCKHLIRMTTELENKRMFF